MRNYIITLVLLLLFASSIRSQSVDFKNTIVRLENNIQETMHKGVEDGWYGVINIPDLLFMTIIQDKDLYNIFCNPAKYKKQILGYINNDSVKWEYKYFALGLLQGLCIQEYLSILENIYNYFDTKIVNPPVDLAMPIRENNFHPSLDVLKLSIDQGKLSQEICKNYNNKLLKKILNHIVSNEKMPFEIKKYCEDVMNGYIYRQRKMLIKKHLIIIPLVECKNGKSYYRSFSFFQG